MAAPILQELIAHLPEHPASRALGIALGAAGAGLLLSLIGARVSRSFFTLVGVAAGAWIGLQAPRWMGWDIDAMALSIGGALVFGLVGYLLHLAWVALTLGALLASAGAFVVLHRAAADGVTWNSPAIDWGAPLALTLHQLWDAVPAAISRLLPLVSTICFIFAGTMCWMVPKLARVMAFSLLGSALLAGGCVAATAMARPQWLGLLPESTQTQGMALALLVVLSAVIQWILCPRSPKTGASPYDNATRASRPPRDVRDLGATTLGPLNLKEARA